LALLPTDHNTKITIKVNMKLLTTYVILILVASASFSKRFKGLVQGLSDTELGYVLGVSADAARKVRNGDIKSLKLEAALRLARELKLSPWYLAGEPEPATPLAASPEDGRSRKSSQKNRQMLERTQLETAEGALLLHDEVVELRARVRRLEAALEELQSRAAASSAL
jgi:transcriptional regulator with XRE-family HTH domain